MDLCLAYRVKLLHVERGLLYFIFPAVNECSSICFYFQWINWNHQEARPVIEFAPSKSTGSRAIQRNFFNRFNLSEHRRADSAAGQKFELTTPGLSFLFIDCSFSLFPLFSSSHFITLTHTYIHNISLSFSLCLGNSLITRARAGLPQKSRNQITPFIWQGGNK